MKNIVKVAVVAAALALMLIPEVTMRKLAACTARPGAGPPS